MWEGYFCRFVVSVEGYYYLVVGVSVGVVGDGVGDYVCLGGGEEL